MTKPAPSHPDVEIFETTTVAARHLRIDTLRFRHRLFSGEWSGERSYDVLRRGQAVAIVLYDPDRGAVVLGGGRALHRAHIQVRKCRYSANHVTASAQYAADYRP